MAFTGTPTVHQISDREVRITGVSLASAAAGTIALFGHAAGPDVVLPAAFQPSPYEYNGATVSLQDSIELIPVNAAIGVATAIPLAVVKTGTTPADFLITVTNTHGSLATPNQELRVKFH